MRRLLFPFGLRPTADPEGPRYADVYERGLAAGIDVMLIFTILGAPFEYIRDSLYANDMDALARLYHPNNWHDVWLNLSHPTWWMNNAVQLGIIGMIIIACQKYFDVTPGKWLLGLRVRRNESLEKPSIVQYITRYLGYIPAAPFFFLISFNKKRRGIHDYIAGTVVIHIRPKGWYWEQIKRYYRFLANKDSRPPIK